MNAQQTYCVSLVLLSPCLGVLTSSLPNPIPWDQGHLMILRKQKQEEEDFWRLPTPHRHSCPSASAQARSPFPPLVCPICAPDKANPPPAHQVSPLLPTLGHQVPLPPTSSIFSPVLDHLHKRSANVFCKESASKYFRPCEPYDLCHNHSTLLSRRKAAIHSSKTK